jgi:uncharacterized peroxidase-related enzyme
VAHIDLSNSLFGLPALLQYRPDTAGPLRALADALLRGPSPLARGERELIAAYVSTLNECAFCAGSHGASAAVQLPGGDDVVAQVCGNAETAPIDDRLKALLRVAAAVRRDGHEVTSQLVEQARAAGADDVEIHDTVLIAAAFAMYNRYVDGLAAPAPEDPHAYRAMADRLVTGAAYNPPTP